MSTIDSTNPLPPPRPDEPLDAANQSLAEALRASFRILKGIMLVLVVLYLFSNFRRIESHEQALLVRLGDLQPDVYEAGLVWAFPFPIDEIVPLPTRKSNELAIDSHTFHRGRDEVGRPLAMINRGPQQGLKPTLDGALLTGDAGLVHVRWKIIYKFDDVADFVSRVSVDLTGRELQAAEALIRTLVENVGIHVAAGLTAEDIIRTRVEYVQGEMRRRLNEQLDRLGAGINVTVVEIREVTPPITVRKVFDDTQRADNAKQQHIRIAEQEATRILNEVAGAAHHDLLDALRLIDDPAAEPAVREEARAELDRLLEHRVEGKAGRIIRDAGAYLSRVVSQMQSDVDRYRALLPEYRRNPSLLFTRLLQQTKRKIMNYPEVVKLFRPAQSELRIQVPLDPEQARRQEEQRLQEQEFDASGLRPERLVPLGPEDE